MKKFQSIFYFFLFALIPLFADEPETSNGVTVDLREPTYCEGVLTTEKGGVISGPNLRIQALNMSYTHTEGDEGIISSVEANGQLIIQIGEYTFVGESITYDLENRCGIIYNGRTELQPWFFGGSEIELRSDGSYIIYDAFITTSENIDREWDIHASVAEIHCNKYLKARRVAFRVMRYPILWVPSLSANLDTIFDNPLTYRFRWGGTQGPRVGFTYEVFSWEHWKTFIRFDYRLTRGPGGGFETFYHSDDNKTTFESTNYIATDSSLSNPNENLRYRVEGKFKKQFNDDKTNILFTYDYLSDIDLPSEYHDNDFYIETSNRTQLLIRRQEQNWICKLYSRLRVNYFQTVKEELPTFYTLFRPTLLANTGIISENLAQASYLNFQYASSLAHVNNFESTRFEYRPNFYRPISLGQWSVLPEVGGIGIFYGNSPKDKAQCLLQAHAGVSVNTSLFKFYGPLKHVIEPYTRYKYYTFPTSSPHDHYIFDINDGWYRLNQWTFGCSNTLFAKRENGCIKRLLFVDLYTHAFPDTPTFKKVFPKVYAKSTFSVFENVRHTLSTAWDLEEYQLDHFNFLSEFTLSADYAVSVEYRHRDAFSWRKADQENFFLDSYRSIESLRHSSLSDRRDTLLLHFFYRFDPRWTAEVVTRQGWNRQCQPDYLEYEINLFTTIRTAWNWKFSYQHLQGEDRVAMYVNVGLTRPNTCREDESCFCYE